MRCPIVKSECRRDCYGFMQHPCRAKQLPLSGQAAAALSGCSSFGATGTHKTLEGLLPLDFVCTSSAGSLPP